MKLFKSDWGYIFFMGGAYAAYFSGSGFGSGQEMTQYFAVHGPKSLIGLWAGQILSALCAILLIRDTRTYRLKTLSQVYGHYCGKTLGKIFYFFSVTFLFTLSTAMVAGSGAIFAQYFHVSAWIGRAFMCVLVVVISLMGLRGMLKVSGLVGPVVLLAVVVVSVVSIAAKRGDFSAGTEYLATNALLRISTSHVTSAALYFSLCAIYQTSYWHGIAATRPDSTRNICGSVFVGTAAFSSVCSVSVLALVANAADLDGVQIPNLALGLRMGPLVGAVYGFVLMVAAYPSATIMIWSLSRIFGGDKRIACAWYTVGIVTLVFAASGLGSFNVIVNIVSKFSSYIGFLFVIPFFYTKLIRRPAVPAWE